MEPGNPAFGATVLRIPAVQSPNFSLVPFVGWKLSADGTLYAADIVLPDGQGVSVFFSATPPVTSHVGDLWYNIANGLQLSQWNGSAWVAYQIGSGAIAPAGIEPSNIAALTAALVGNVGVLNPNPYFLGGVGSDYTAINALSGAPDGTFAVVSGGALPAGAPFAFAGQLTGTTDAFGVLAEQFGTFSATVGQQYQVTCWAYCQNTQVALGILWSDTSLDVNFITVVPNTWTEISTVITGAVAGPAFPFAGPSSAGDALYVQALLVLPQVPGGLIQTGTIEAAQIAAGTITAGLLAAGIVVAGIIDGTTVNAATFNGSVFNGTDWIENATGSFYYSSTPGAGTLAFSISPNGGNDPFGTTVLNGFQAQAGSGGYFQVTGAGIVYKNVHNAGGGLTPTTTLSITSDPSNDFVFFNAVASSGGSGTVKFTGPLLILANTAVQITGQITATGGSAAAPTLIATDTWHNITLDAGWTAGAQVPQYRLLPDGNVQVRGQATHAGVTTATNINNSNPVPAAYQPGQNRVYRPPTAGDTAGTVQISTAGVFAMRASGFTATQVFMDGIYSI